MGVKIQQKEAGKAAQVITSAYFQPVLLMVAKDAMKVLSPDPIRFLQDRATACQGVAEDELVRAAFFGGVELAAGPPRHRTCPTWTPVCARLWRTPWRRSTPGRRSLQHSNPLLIS